MDIPYVENALKEKGVRIECPMCGCPRGLRQIIDVASVILYTNENPDSKILANPQKCVSVCCTNCGFTAQFNLENLLAKF